MAAAALVLATAAAPGTSATAATAPDGSPSASADPGSLGAPNPEIVADARQAPLVRYNKDLPGGAYTNMGNSGGGTIIMAYAALAGDTSVDDRILTQIRYTLTGGNDIAANGGYPAQHELQVTGLIAVVKNIPRIWGQLTQSERAKVDAMMEASLIGSAFTTSDNNPFVVAGGPERTLDADTNVGRGWNPNFREGMGGSVLVAAAYFGVQRAEGLLATYDHDAFTSRLCDLGLDNSCQTFNWQQDHPESIAPTGEQIESAVHDWSLWGVPLDDVMGLEDDLASNTYGRRVACGLDDGRGIPVEDAPGGFAGVIDSGCAGLPNLGQPGMLLEFDSVDGGGPRSATYYAYGGLKPSLFVQAALMANGLWEPGAVSDKVGSLTAVGSQDLWYKLEHGYRNYSIGSYHGTQTIDDPGYGFGYTQSLWDDVVAPYYGIVPAPGYVLATFDTYVGAGTLVGVGSGASAEHRLAAVRDLVAEASDLIEAGDYGSAVTQLADAQTHIDTGGEQQADTFVTGDDAGTLYGLVERLKTAIADL